uniref:BTB domain-containing protein n=1 Tax=Ditylenchus dipsaci TaxID=166011 RepID=A0A915CVE2_9BILA
MFPQGLTDPASLIIPQTWKLHVDGSPFVIYDSGIQTVAHRIIIMSSSFMLQKLFETASFAADGTFLLVQVAGVSFTQFTSVSTIISFQLWQCLWPTSQRSLTITSYKLSACVFTKGSKQDGK